MSGLSFKATFLTDDKDGKLFDFKQNFYKNTFLQFTK